MILNHQSDRIDQMNMVVFFETTIQVSQRKQAK